jgi:hypothetical protein
VTAAKRGPGRPPTGGTAPVKVAAYLTPDLARRLRDRAAGSSISAVVAEALEALLGAAPNGQRLDSLESRVAALEEQQGN